MSLPNLVIRISNVISRCCSLHSRGQNLLETALSFKAVFGDTHVVASKNLPWNNLAHFRNSSFTEMTLKGVETKNYSLLNRVDICKHCIIHDVKLYVSSNF